MVAVGQASRTLGVSAPQSPALLWLLMLAAVALQRWVVAAGCRTAALLSPLLLNSNAVAVVVGAAVCSSWRLQTLGDLAVSQLCSLPERSTSTWRIHQRLHHHPFRLMRKIDAAEPQRSLLTAVCEGLMEPMSPETSCRFY